MELTSNSMENNNIMIKKHLFQLNTEQIKGQFVIQNGMSMISLNQQHINFNN